MPTKCDKCGEEDHVIYITRKYEKLCGKCYDKVRPKVDFDPDDLPRVIRSY